MENLTDGAHCWQQYWGTCSGSTMNFHIWHSALLYIENGNKIAEKSGNFQGWCSMLVPFGNMFRVQDTFPYVLIHSKMAIKCQTNSEKK